MLADCAVCPNKTTKPCGGCKSISFCSKACQKLIWATHRYVCTESNSEIFKQPPLTKEEKEYLMKEYDYTPEKGAVMCEKHFGSESSEVEEQEHEAMMRRQAAENPEGHQIGMVIALLHNYSQGQAGTSEVDPHETVLHLRIAALHQKGHRKEAERPSDPIVLMDPFCILARQELDAMRERLTISEEDFAKLDERFSTLKVDQHDPATVHQYLHELLKERDPRPALNRLFRQELILFTLLHHKELEKDENDKVRSKLLRLALQRLATIHEEDSKLKNGAVVTKVYRGL